MKSLSIPSLTSREFRELVNDSLSFRMAIINAIQDTYEQSQLVSGLVNVAVSLFTGEKPVDREKLMRNIKDEGRRRLLRDPEAMKKAIPYLKLEE